LTSTGTYLSTPLTQYAGSLTSSGLLLKDVRQLLFGTLTTSGVTTKLVSQILTGVLTSIGTLVNFVPTVTLPQVRFQFAQSFDRAFIVDPVTKFEFEIKWQRKFDV